MFNFQEILLQEGGFAMMGKFVCGMATGIVVGSMMGAAAKAMMEKNERNKLTKKAKKLLRKAENYLNDSVPFMD